MSGSKLERSDQKDLLRQMVERVVVNPEGKITQMGYLPPFSYLRHVTERVQNSGGGTVAGKQNASAKAAIFSYVMGFYNRVRRHSALGYLSPHDFEMQFLRQTCTPLN